MKYSPKVVCAFFKEEGLPEPRLEWLFHPIRKWRFDFAFDALGERPLALEVQGAIFSGGRHTRGAALVKEYEKLNEAAALGWRILYVQPKDLCTVDTADLIKRCLSL